ncbi:MAG: outer membrane protein assembly factor [Gemmatimonadales bacterium]
MLRAWGAALLVAALLPAGLAAQERSDLAVGSVGFDGNRALDDYTLAAAIATSGSSWTYRTFHIGDRRPFDELELRRDVVRLQLLYRQHGFYDARVDTTIERGATIVRVKFRIEEGPPVVVDSVAVLGVDSVRDLAASLVLKRGGPFDRVLFDASADSLVFALRDRGFPFVEVYRNYSVDRRARTAVVVFVVEPGPRSRIGAISVEGNRQVGEGVVRGALTFREGDEFRQSALFDSQRSLYQSGLYHYVSVALQRDTATAAGDSLVRVRVQVAEAAPVQTRVGVGYGTIDCFRSQGTMSFLNFLGEARRLDLTARVSKIGVGDPLHLENSACPELANDPYSDRLNYLGSITLTQPGVPVRRSAVSVSAFAEQRSELQAYRLQSVGAAISLKFGFGRLVPFSISYRVSSDQTHAEPATFCKYFNQCDASTLAEFAAARREANVTLTLVSTRTDAPLEPTSGHTLSLEITTARRSLGSQIAFDRVVGEAIGYKRLVGRTVLAARLRAGVVVPGQSVIGNAPLTYVPPGERFYAGGPTTVRGFAPNEMGPQVYVVDSVHVNPDSSVTYAGLRSSPVGNYGILLANVELRVPTPLWGGRIGVNVFADAGRLWDYNGTGYVPGDLRITPGAGLQISTPLGPMRLDAAYNGRGAPAGPLYRISGSDLVAVPGGYPEQPPGRTLLSRLQLHFSVGIAF